MRGSPGTLPSLKTWAVLAAAVTAAHALVLQVPADHLALKKLASAPHLASSAVPSVVTTAPELAPRPAPFDTRQLQPVVLAAVRPVTGQAARQQAEPAAAPKPPPAQAAPSRPRTAPTAMRTTVVAAAEPEALPAASLAPATRSEPPQEPAQEPMPEAAREVTHEATHEAAREPAAPASPGRTVKKPASGKAAGGPAVSPRLPASRRLLYDVVGEAKKFPYTAHAELLWQQDGSEYSTRLEIAALFLPSRVQTSQGQITPQGLAPRRFSDKLRTEVAAHFDRDKGKVIFSANTPQASLQPGAQDRLSVLLQLAGLLAGEPGRYPTGSSISMQTIGPRDADEWRFVVGAEENLALGDGSHPARKLSRAPQRDYDLHVDVWLALDMGYLPVQLRMTQSNGDFVQLQLKSAENM